MPNTDQHCARNREYSYGCGWHGLWLHGIYNLADFYAANVKTKERLLLVSYQSHLIKIISSISQTLILLKYWHAYLCVFFLYQNFKSGHKLKDSRDQMVLRRTSLVVHWLRIYLPCQEAWVQSFVQKIPLATGQLSPWITTTEPALSYQSLSTLVCSAVREATTMRRPHATTRE